MDQIIDSCIWVDYLRPSTTAPVRLLAHKIISRSSIAICEPIQFELLRLIPQNKRNIVETTLAIIPVLITPVNLWHQATLHGQHCRDQGIQTSSMDLLIATICHHYKTPLVTFDIGFKKIASIIGFSVEIVTR